MVMFAPFKGANLRSNFADAYAKQGALEQAQKKQENAIRAQNLLGSGMLYKGITDAAGISPISDALRKHLGPSPTPKTDVITEGLQAGLDPGAVTEATADIGAATGPAPTGDVGAFNMPNMGLSPDAVSAGTEGMGLGYTPPPGTAEGLVEGSAELANALAAEGTAGTSAILPGATTAGTTAGTAAGTAGAAGGAGAMGALGTAMPWLGAAMALYSLLS